MINSISFKTRARTVDHLGREQIADVPTAISELWKNSYDAYARNSDLTIFDGEQPVVAISDDGHGMSYDEFIERWLVIGTESKLLGDKTKTDETFGLKKRAKQGQKGIGRLSSAHLGPLLLVVSKRQNEDFVAALIDWRIFENPYLMLSDIEIPVTKFSEKELLFSQLPDLFEQLMVNVWGGAGDERSDRIKQSWQAYDAAVLEGTSNGKPIEKPSEMIASTIVETSFEEHQLSHWPVWQDATDHGTVLLISQISEDFLEFLPGEGASATGFLTKERFVKTLSAFVDPLFDPARPEINAADPEFNYSVNVESEGETRVIVSTAIGFGRRDTDELEHILDGTIDNDGVFRGQIKAFGKWIKTGSDYVIPPPGDVNITSSEKGTLGPVDFYAATFEQNINSSTLSKAQSTKFGDLLEIHSGLMVYRNGLRVLPFGREDNDFFEIEKRRARHAGRHFWNARRMFGRLAISREKNPNLKDKAGREGIIVNKAAKVLKLLVENILITAAADYFGIDSENRRSEVLEIQQANKEEKAKQAATKLRRKQRKQFRTKLQENIKVLPNTVMAVRTNFEDLVIQSAEDILPAQEALEDAKRQFSEMRVPGAPKILGTLEEEYSEYLHSIRELSELISDFSDDLQESIEKIDPDQPWEILEKQLQRNAAQIHARIRKWSGEIRSLHEHEGIRVQELVSTRNKSFHERALPLIEQLKNNRISLAEATKLLESWHSEFDQENEDIFESYILALESLRDDIDIQSIAVMGVDENEDLRAEVDRLNALAQLGITVEILAHELKSYDQMIASGIDKLPGDLKNSKAVRSIEAGYEGLAQQLNFLAPLKLSGHRSRRFVSGKEIFDYVDRFFEKTFKRNNISFTASEKFMSFQVLEQESRLYPVFINLVNNSQYWLANSDVADRKIILDVIDEKIVVSDNGPGVDVLDHKRLFTLFFTRKLRGGRGVGLYICKANLAAGGHSIECAIDIESMPLPGANFLIKFQSIEFND